MRIEKYKHGDEIPEGGRYLYSRTEHEESHKEWGPSPGIRGMIPIFGMETLYRISKPVEYHYYEFKN
jgi:hypothetical protein